MARRLRIQVTITYPMMVALEVLGARNGLVPSAQAALTMRQALERTMGSAEVSRRVASHNAQRSHAQWSEDISAEHAIETAYAASAGQHGGDMGVGGEPQETAGRTSVTVR